MIEDLKNRILATSSFQKLEGEVGKLVPGETASAMGVAGSLTALLAALLHERLGRQLLVVARDRETAERLRDDLTLSLRSRSASLFAGQGKAHTPGDVAGDV